MMEITQITVTIHEKRNHPYEFGHFDCGVTLTADLDTSGLEAHDVIALLRAKARVQVLEECDNWQINIEEKKRIDKLLTSIRYQFREFLYSTRNRLEIAKTCLRLIEQLPEDMQADYRQQLSEEMARSKRRAEKTAEARNDDVPF